MFERIRKDDSELQEEIKRILNLMSTESPDSEKYKTMSEELVKLHALKKKRERVSPDAILTIAANLLGILLIVAVEQENVVASKALNFVRKLF